MTLWWLVSFFILTLLVAALVSRIKGVEKPSKMNVRDTPLKASSQ
jgi:4-hydroxybenzoate polyprenyltransferase